MIAARSTAAAAQTDDSSMTAAAGAEARVQVTGCEDLVTAWAGESRRIAEASITASGEARTSRRKAGITSNISEANVGDAMDVISSRGIARTSAKAGETRVTTGRVDGATTAEARVVRREGRSTMATLN